MPIFTSIGAALFGAGTFLAGATAFALQTAVGVGLSLVAKAFAGKPQGPKFSVQGKLQAGGDIPRSFIIGYYATAGSLVYANTWGEAGGTPNAFLTQVIDVSDLPCQSLDQVWVNGELVTLDTDNEDADLGFPVEEYRKGSKDHLWIKFKDGTQVVADSFLTGTVSSVSRPWQSTRVGVGVAHVIATARINEDLFTGFPTYKFALTGVPLFDLSKSESPGHIWETPATWGGDGDHLPAVQIYNLLRGISYGGEWFYGLQNLPAARLPEADWIAEIEKCRALIDGPDGSEATYRTGGEIQVGAQIGDAIEAILTGCQGRLAEIGGTYKLKLGAPGSADFAFTDDDILSTEEQVHKPFFDLVSSVTRIDATYPNPEEGWNPKVAPTLIDAALEETLGRRFASDVDLDLVPYKGQVQRLMKSALAEAQRMRRHTLVLPPSFWTVEPGDILAWTSTRNGYVAKLFRADGVVDQANLDVMVDITEVDPSDYDWDQDNDYTDPVDGPVGPIRPPAQEMSGWTVAPATIQSGNFARPSIEVSFDGDLDDIEFVRVQARLAATAEVVFDGSLSYGEPDTATKSVILNGQFLPDTDYEVRGRFLPFSGRETEWSAWLAVTTPDTRLSEDELADEVQSALQLALTKLPQDIFLVRQMLDEANDALQTAIAAINEQQGQINLGVGSRYGENKAAAELALASAADANSAVAALFLNLFAKNQQGEAEGLIRFVAAALSDGAVASFALEIRATYDQEFAEAGLYFDVGAFEGGASSRFRLVADQGFFDNGNGLVLPVFLLSIANEPRDVDVVAGSPNTLTVDLSSRLTSFRTTLAGDATYKFPDGAKPGMIFRHEIIQDGSGGHTLAFDAETTWGDAPTIDETAEIVNLLEVYIRSIAPQKMWARLLDADTEEPPDPIAFVDDYEDNSWQLSPINDAGGQAGEIMMIFVVAQRDGAAPPNVSSPTGWQLAGSLRFNGSPHDHTAAVFYRRLDGSETATVSFLNTLLGAHILAVRFTGGEALSHGLVNEAGTAGNPSAQAVNVASAGIEVPMIVWALGSASSGVNPLSFSPTEDYDSGQIGAHPDFRVKFKLYNGSLVDSDPANTSIDMDDEGDANILISGYLKA